MITKAIALRVAIPLAVAGLVTSDSGSALVPAGPRNTAMHGLAPAPIVDHVEPVTAELAAAEPSAVPTEETASTRIADHVEQVTRGVAEPSPAVPGSSAAAIAKPGPPRIPQRKPQDRGDRSQQVGALLKQASAAASRTTADTMPSPPARTARAAMRPAIAAPPPSPLQRREADAQPLVGGSAAERDSSIAALQRELQARDELIGNLLARVEQLERYVLLNEDQLDEIVAGAVSPGAVASSPPASPSTSPPSDQPAAQAQPAGNAPEDKAQAPAAPGQFEVDEDAVDRALERTLVQEGVLLLPLGRAETEPSFTYTRRESSAPIFVAQNGTVSVGEQEVRRNEFETNTTLRVGLPYDSQVEVSLPYRLVDQSTAITVNSAPVGHSDGFGSGFGDIRVGAAKTLLRENGGWWPDLIGRLYWDTDTGKSRDNGVVLGGGFNEVGGSLSAVKRQDPLAFVGGVSYEKAFENNGIEPADELGFSIGTFLAASPETSLRFVLNQQFANEFKVDGDTIDGSDRVIGSLTIGAATILGRNVLLDLSAEVGLTDDAPDYAARVAVPIRFNLPVY
jgi:hypothetical protein